MRATLARVRYTCAAPAAICMSLFPGVVPSGAARARATKTARRRAVFVAALLTMIAVLGRAAHAATIFVTTLEQKISATAGCSLQEAIFSANFDKNIAIDSTNPDRFITTECVAGNGHDTIVLPTRAVLQMSSIVDDAYNYMGPTATPIIFTNITIEAHGARLEHTPNGVNFRAFAVGQTSIHLPDGTTVSGVGNLTIRNVHIKGFTVKGGDGAGGGGGGMGAGGAIFVADGALTVEASTFEANGAAGGNGSILWDEDGDGLLETPVAGGGGGGLGGNGGRVVFTLTGGGGGGSRGNGGSTGRPGSFAAGGGGGTVGDGQTGSEGSAGGFRCGGAGATEVDEQDGGDGACRGGGGGGGGRETGDLDFTHGGEGGKGHFGGGGGGGGVRTHSEMLAAGAASAAAAGAAAALTLRAVMVVSAAGEARAPMKTRVRAACSAAAI